jgi:uncharacterized protein
VTVDDLDTPLGQEKRKRLPKHPAATRQILAGILGLFAIAVVAWAIFVNDPLGGEPAAVATTGSIAKPPVKPDTDSQQRSRSDEPSPVKATTAKVVVAPAVTPPPGSKTITIIDGSSGKRQDVIIPGQSNGNAQKPPGN